MISPNRPGDAVPGGFGEDQPPSPIMPLVQFLVRTCADKSQQDFCVLINPQQVCPGSSGRADLAKLPQ